MLWVVLFSCKGALPDTASPADGVILGDERLCETPPVDGFSRFTLEVAERGFTEVVPDLRDLLQSEEERFGAGLAAGDLDGDGDTDLVAGRFQRPPLVYLNDGTGHFAPQEDLLLPIPGTTSGKKFGSGGVTIALALSDLDGDGLPEVITSGYGFLALYPNLGGGALGSPELLLNDETVLGVYLGFSVGDLDGDADLDIALISDLAIDVACSGGDECMYLEYPDYLLYNDGGLSFSLAEALYSAPDAGSHSMIGLLTDRDNDDDLDLFVPKDYLGENAFWRNDGGTWVDDDAAIGADYTWSAMGVDSVDLNGDGFFDYCLTDTGPIKCLMSTGSGDYIEGGAALGLVPTSMDDPSETVGWSLRFSDLDNDGYWDAAAPSAPMGQQLHTSREDIPDAMWAGQPDGTFKDVSVASGFQDTNDNYAMVQADFDGDGFQEIVLSGPGQPLQFYDNACNENHWIELDFEGPGLNTEGWGARVTVEAGGRRWTRELITTGGPGHSPPLVSIGLGDIDQVDRVSVSWPGGASAVAVDLPTRRRVTLSAQ